MRGYLGLVVAAWWVCIAAVGMAAAGVLDDLDESLGFVATAVRAEDLKRYETTAEDGNPMSHLALALLYERGVGMPQSWVLAHKHFNLAGALSISPEAAAIRQAAHRRMSRLEARMGAEQVGQAQEGAKEWMTSFERRESLRQSIDHGKRWFEEKWRDIKNAATR